LALIVVEHLKIPLVEITDKPTVTISNDDRHKDDIYVALERERTLLWSRLILLSMQNGNGQNRATKQQDQY